MDIRYAPIWLRERDLDQLFTEHGIAESDRREWLSRAVRDRGIVTTRKADPAVDLFRLASPPSPLVGGFARRWKPNPDDIDWDIFGIRSPVSGLRRVFGYDPTPIEVSAELLKAMLVGTTVESDRKDGGEATANADVGGGQKAVPPSKRFSAETADQFTRTFIATEIAEK